MLSHEKAILLITQLTTKSSKLIFPPQNFIDLIWKDKPARLKEVIFIQPVEFMGKEASQKLAELRFWIKKQQSTSLPYSKTPPALITSPSSIGAVHIASI
jgi:Xaa-Pro aminopeptidase